MIFDIFKGIDLKFDISLDKEQYMAGEKVKGTLLLATNKGFKARALRLISEGEEKTRIETTESRSGSFGSSTSTSNTTRTYSESNIFFSRDLSDILKDLGNNVLEDGEIEVNARTNKEIPFEFDLPTDILPSYNGKHSTISYSVKATADRPKRIDVNKKITFNVSNSSYRDFNSQSGKNSPIARNNLKYTNENIKDTDTRPDGISQFFGKSFPSYISPTGFGISIDLSNLMAKSRDKFLKEGTGAILDLGTGERVYQRGDRVECSVVLLADEKIEKIKNITISLYGIEHAFAKGLERTTTVEKFKKEVEAISINRDGNNAVIPIEIEIPRDVNVSYVGKYSEYYWGVEAKLNAGLLSHIYAKTIINII
jgi:hypothetical protein